MRAKASDSLFIHSPRLNLLNILEQIEGDSRLTQAELASRCRLSVAMVNNYMQDLCRSGLLEYHRRSSKSVTYHVTAKGETQLSEIRHALLLEMTDLYDQAKERICRLVLRRMPRGLHRAVLVGCGHIAELALHALESADIQVVGICSDDPAHVGRELGGHAILALSQVRHLSPDAIIIADLSQAEDTNRDLAYLQDRGIPTIRIDNVTAAGATADMAQKSRDPVSSLAITPPISKLIQLFEKVTLS